jgi:hypothetical protein
VHRVAGKKMALHNKMIRVISLINTEIKGNRVIAQLIPANLSFTFNLYAGNDLAGAR